MIWLVAEKPGDVEVGAQERAGTTCPSAGRATVPVPTAVTSAGQTNALAVRRGHGDAQRVVDDPGDDLVVAHEGTGASGSPAGVGRRPAAGAHAFEASG